MIRTPVLLLPLLAAACVTTRTVTYLPSAEQPRLSLAEGREMLGRFVGVECARLREAGRAEGSAPVAVTLDAAGNATGAELLRSSGDARADGVMGAVAAQLRLEPAGAAGGRVTLTAGYRCGDDGTVSATLDSATAGRAATTNP